MQESQMTLLYVSQTPVGGSESRSRPSLLAVSDRPQVREELAYLVADSFEIRVSDFAQAQDAIESHGLDVLAVDGEAAFGDALSLLAWARQCRPHVASV